MSAAGGFRPDDGATVDATAARVDRYLHFFGVVEVDDDGDRVVEVSDVKMYVRVEKLGDEHSTVRMFCQPRTGIESTDAVFRLVATENTYRFGKLWLFEESDNESARLFLDHTLLGTYLDPDELITCIELMAVTAKSLRTDPRFGCRGVQIAQEGSAE